ncbi:MAG TPA: tRNA (N6-isopentenyl adenosine(37)-C2)-methylthiotransferase MiaB [Candidatus Pullichristensenella excrementigallinarum]|uniref:tRNA-2-methylthio-N(6)-dimethylallyladenosine synthase n=1 Tax=Candidatus Pullichristensenella excrementigallinarum TaxID=2840907 RepID=A0A9D1IC45_9FIRM|nr:tRNA (N6-isopentenyl adenosine(37)-C2)-methylthiotransferase MiaB [Candidatus Pullichristensenella excrementigallinarum]
MQDRPLVPESEIHAQREFMDRVRLLAHRPQSYHIVTLGCQMNERDSETIAGMLDAMGLCQESVREKADLILYNTCCVRENAENRALGNVIWLKELKKERPEILICVGGCMTQEEGMARRMKEMYPFIDLVFGTHNMYRLPEYLFRLLSERHPVIEVVNSDGSIAEGLPEKRASKYSAFINIMYGCNNFCSYCIVPYVRGRERSRDPEMVLEEAKRLLDAGVQEITLLGQNVNSYMGGGSAFAELLYRLDRLGIPRIRFMTSHPKDLSEELIAAYAEIKSLMPHLHLPVQSGNNEILRRMNRRYTRERYLELVEKLRKACPDIGLTTDIIVGFPGETEQQFLDTLSLVEEVRFDSAFTFIFSPRKGTRAAEMPDETPYALKSERIQLLIDRQQAISREILLEQVGKVETVLVESVSARDAQSVGGKTPRSHMVNFPGNAEWIGRFMPVEIVSAGKNTLRGKILEG